MRMDARGCAATRAILVLVVVLGVLMASPRGLVAQDEPPKPGEVALSYVPVAEALGPAWKRFEPTAVPNLAADTFREGATVVYGGPEGARVILTALVVDDGRVRRGWEGASALYDTARYAMTYDYEREEQLRNVPAPPGCAEAKRIEGRLYFDGFETGVTLCAADPDVILLAVASGRVNDEAGFAAADNVVVAALAAAGAEPAAAGESTGLGGAAD